MPNNIFVKVESVEAKINMEVLSRLNIFGIMMYLAVQRYLIVIHKWKFRGHSFLWYIHENCDGFGAVDKCDLCFKPVSETTILENVLTFQDQNFSRDTCSALFSSLSLAHPSEHAFDNSNINSNLYTIYVVHTSWHGSWNWEYL